MDYERIHKVQSGMISPSKLRMRLLGSHNAKKKDGSASNSSRTSPSRMEDPEFVKNSLLASSDGDFGVQVSPAGVAPNKPETAASEPSQGVASSNSLLLSSSSGSGYPARACEDENLDYDSTSSFEFHRGERPLHHTMTRNLSRPMPSKWNDAEKWIMNKQSAQRKNNVQTQGNWPSAASNLVRVAPEENKASVKRVDFVQPVPQTGALKSGFFAHGVAPALGLSAIDLSSESKDLTEVEDEGCTKSVTEENKGAAPMVRSVSMRDMGTEMTPIPSQEPSRSATPQSATTPLRSPTSSMPSTPRRGEPAPTPTELCIKNTTTQNSGETGKKEMSEQELKLKTRKEIMALGVQLGKLNIAAWASKDEKDKSLSGIENAVGDDPDPVSDEYARRAADWEEAEKAKHAARFKREEIRLQAWEDRQKAKLEAEMRKIEAQIEQMRAQAQAKMVKKIALARQKSEEKRAAAEAQKNRLAEKTAAQAEYIRHTGRIPPSRFMCCGW